MKIYNLLNKCTSPKVTEELLKENKDNQVLKDYLKAMLDPGITYGIKKIPTVIDYKYDVIDTATLLRNLPEVIKKLKAGYNICIPEIQEMLTYIIKRKHPNKIGIKVVNKVWPDLIFQVPYHGCLPGTKERLEKLPWDTGINVQKKEDGMAVLAFVGSDETRLYTRNSKEITIAFPKLCKEFSTAFSKYWGAGSLEIDYIHAELMVYTMKDDSVQAYDRKTGNGILNKIIKGTEKESDYIVFPTLLDMIDARNFKSDCFQEDRYMYLWEAYSKVFDIVEQRTMYSIKDAREWANQLISDGFEGVVCKDPEGIWKDGKSASCLKIKHEFECEMKVINFRMHTEKRGEIGSLVCISDDSIVTVAVSGLTDIERQMDFNTNWYNKIITVRANSLIKDKRNFGYYSLYLPRFIEIREDKNKADTFKEIKEASKCK